MLKQGTIIWSFKLFTDIFPPEQQQMWGIVDFFMVIRFDKIARVLLGFPPALLSLIGHLKTSLKPILHTEHYTKYITQSKKIINFIMLPSLKNCKYST